MRVQLSSIRSDIKEICKDVKQCHSFNFFFLFWKIQLFFIKYDVIYVKFVITILNGLIFSWSSNTLATWYKELTHLKRPWCWEKLKAGGEGDDRAWDSWMASPTQWTWVWVSSGSWWWTGKPGCCSPWGRKESDTTEWLNWTEWISEYFKCL